jgi:hypothetical protein
MSDFELIKFADQYLAIRINHGTARTAILTKITGAALAARDIA